MGFFYRHNIHPYTECLKREETLQDYARNVDLRVIYQDDYKLEEFLQKAVFRESKRCTICYHDRLAATAHLAKRGKFDCFSSEIYHV